MTGPLQADHADKSSIQEVFSYRQALESLPQVRRITREAVQQVESLSHRIKSRDELQSKLPEIEAATRSIFDDWQQRIRSLGCHPKGMWLVDWDSGDGYYCWRYPEPTIGHHHGYVEGFEGRVPVA